MEYKNEKRKITQKLITELYRSIRKKTPTKQYVIRDTEQAGFMIRYKKTISFYVSYGRANEKSIGKAIEGGGIDSKHHPETYRRIAKDLRDKRTYGGINPEEYIRTKAIENKKKENMPTLGQYIEREVSEDHYKKNKSELNKFSHLYHVKMDEFTMKEFDVYIEKRRVTKKGSDPVSYNTIARDFTSLRSIFNQAVKYEVINEYPDFKVDRRLREDTKRKERLSDEERERLVLLVHKMKAYQRMKTQVLIAMMTGVRKGALLSIKWEDIDFENKTIFFRAENDKKRKELLAEIDEQLCIYLKEYRNYSEPRQEDEYVYYKTRDSKGVEGDDRYIAQLDNKTAWSALKKATKLKNFRWHGFRHNFISTLISNGVDIETVRKLANHSKIEQTAKYIDVSDDKKSEAIRGISEMLKNKDNNSGLAS
jgi:integrase